MTWKEGFNLFSLHSMLLTKTPCQFALRVRCRGSSENILYHTPNPDHPSPIIKLEKQNNVIDPNVQFSPLLQPVSCERDRSGSRDWVNLQNFIPSSLAEDHNENSCHHQSYSRQSGFHGSFHLSCAREISNCLQAEDPRERFYALK